MNAEPPFARCQMEDQTRRPGYAKRYAARTSPYIHTAVQMRHTVQVSLAVVSTVVLLVTAYWLLTRSARIAAIDYELNLGYATDRFGEPSDPSKPDSGDVWRAEQIATDNKVTFGLIAAAAPAVLWVLCSMIKRSNGAGTDRPTRSVSRPKED
jgi:cytochrome bd-type quinol oxidase subunit 1